MMIRLRDVRMKIQTDKTNNLIRLQFQHQTPQSQSVQTPPYTLTAEDARKIAEKILDAVEHVEQT